MKVRNYEMKFTLEFSLVKELSEFSLGDFRIRELLRTSGFVLLSKLLGELLQIWGIRLGYHIRHAINYTRR